ncbi:ATP synthase subunit I [Fortiea contorta]|uniref:ATP synthase subunit I n=1 Tax=Fortiea contorta TaxID=1892405 RepID=UPI0003454549
MSLSEESTAPTPTTQQDAKTDSGDAESGKSMQEFHQLYQKLLVITLVLTGIIFICVWIFYSLNIALNYLIGACTGVVYLRMLAKDVEQLGGEKRQLSKTRFALFIGLIVLATQWRELQIVPIFLGFLTYKATLLVYMVQTAFLPDS